MTCTNSPCKSVCFLYWHLPSQCYINGAFHLLRIALLALMSAYQDLPSSFLVPVLLQRLTRPSRSTQFLSSECLRRTAWRKLVGATRNAMVTRNNLIFVCGSVTPFLRRVQLITFRKVSFKSNTAQKWVWYQVTYSCRCRHRSKCRQVLFSGVLTPLPLVSQVTVAYSTSKQVS